MQSKLLSNVACLLLDIDGTIILGKKAAPGARRFFQALEQTGRSYLVVTNNDAFSLAEHAQRLGRAGLPVKAGNILSAAEVAAEFLKKQWQSKTVMVLGAQPLRDTLVSEGIGLTDEKPDCVVVGFDTELGYQRLKQACFLIEAGCKWLATHPDLAMPSPEGFWPDCGAITAAISATTGRKPDVVLGKPSKFMAQTAIRRSGFSAEQVMTVGDRAETDVLLAKENGMYSALVLTGATSREQALNCQADLLLDDLGQLAQLLYETPL